MPLHPGTSPRQEHLLVIIDQYSISTNHAPEAIFSFQISTLSIWCTPTDHPNGVWNQYRWIHKPMSHLTKKSAIALAHSMLLYSESAQDIIGFTLQTHASSLAGRGLIPRTEIENRPEDVAWATQKLVWLWAQAFPTEPPPYIELEWDRDKPKVDYSDIF
jgi:hypothetical protein